MNPSDPGEAGAYGPARILVVDDDRDLVEILRLLLEREGHHVISAYNAVDGLALAEAERPDLLILDVMMPEGTEGFHLVWQLRARPEPWFRQVPIIMLTAVHQRTPLRFYPDRADNTYAPGEYLEVTDFIDKPVEPEELTRAVARILHRTRPRPPVG